MTVARTPTTRLPAAERPLEPKPEPVMVAEVRRGRRVSPSFARVTLGGENLAQFEYQGYDQWFRMFIPKEGLEPSGLPTSASESTWYSQFKAAPEDERPDMRYVTVRDFRADGVDGPEMDIDVVVHGGPSQPDCGPLSVWAQTAEPGGRVGLLDQGPTFKSELTAAGVSLVGDEAALPAIAGILRSLPSGAFGRAHIEVPCEDDFQVLSGPAGVEVQWLTREGVSAVPGQLVLAEATRSLAALGAGEHPYVFGAGESRMAASLARALKHDLAWPRGRFTTVGYWHYSG